MPSSAQQALQEGSSASSSVPSPAPSGADLFLAGPAPRRPGYLGHVNTFEEFRRILARRGKRPITRFFS